VIEGEREREKRSKQKETETERIRKRGTKRVITWGELEKGHETGYDFVSRGPGSVHEA